MIKELANKEIRILDFNVLAKYASMLKREKEENSKLETAEDNEYGICVVIQLMLLLPWVGFRPKKAMSKR